MLMNHYSNFVRPSSSEESSKSLLRGRAELSGEEAKRFYLKEIGPDSRPIQTKSHTKLENKTQTISKLVKFHDISKKNLFMSVENNDVQTLAWMLDNCPNVINTTDEYGWSLLMIACQANAVDTVKELLQRGADMSVRDKAGNSARSLVIKNKNVVLADILLSYKTNEPVAAHTATGDELREGKSNIEHHFLCEMCNKEFPDKDEHIASTIHNISASKDKKIPTNYVIPESNRGYQIMLKVGWDKESGLGPDGSGKKYPIKAVQKQDKKGLGHDKKRRKKEESEQTVKHVNRKSLERDCRNNRSMEISFRRQFY